MRLRDLVRGYACLLRHRHVPGYRRLPILERVILDHQALWRWIRTADFWRILLHLTALILAVEVISLELHIQGSTRTLLRSIPPLGAVPLVALARHRYLREILRERRLGREGSRKTESNVSKE